MTQPPSPSAAAQGIDHAPQSTADQNAAPNSMGEPLLPQAIEIKVQWDEESKVFAATCWLYGLHAGYGATIRLAVDDLLTEMKAEPPPPSPSAAALWERLKKDYSVGCAGAFNVLVIRDIEAFAAQAVAAAESESQKHIVAADCRRIWFHGTGSEEAARSILETGFRSNTHFARAMEDAVEFGGPHIFDVLLDVDCDQWQLLLADPVPAVRIARYRIVSTETKFESVERREAFFGTSYMGSYAEPKPYPACPYGAAERAKPAASDREAALRLKAELPHISYSREWLAKVAAALAERGREAWREAAIAWTVCASIHREYAKGKDALFTTRQGDFVKHAEDARAAAIRNQTLTGD